MESGKKTEAILGQEEENTTRGQDERSQKGSGDQARYHDLNNWREDNLRQFVAFRGKYDAEHP